METKLIRTAVCAVIALNCGLSLKAQVVELTFRGTYDTLGMPAFGEVGPGVPYEFKLTYDTSLNTSHEYFPTGVTLGYESTIHPWYGYSASGLIATDLTFGSKTWSATALSARIPAIGITADIWFDSDIAVADPTLSWMFFDDPEGSLEIGGGASNGTEIFMRAASFIFDLGLDPVFGGFGFGFSEDMIIERKIVQGSAPVPTPVPEVASVAPLVFAGLALVFGLRRRAAPTA